MSTKIIIARHGNTFRKDENPRRIGITDIALVEEHRARCIGKFLRENELVPSVIYAAPLLRTMQTATLAIEEIKQNIPLIAQQQFSEIDYGVDENKTEEDVINRIGENALKQWNQNAIVPIGWKVNPKNIINTWIHFSKFVEDAYRNQNVLIVSSNGIIRFAPYITGNFDEFVKHNDIKVGTGHICIFEKKQHDIFWQCICWNKKIY